MDPSPILVLTIVAVGGKPSAVGLFPAVVLTLQVRRRGCKRGWLRFGGKRSQPVHAGLTAAHFKVRLGHQEFPLACYDNLEYKQGILPKA